MAKKAVKNPKLVGTKKERERALAAEADAMTAAEAPAALDDAAEQPDAEDEAITKLTRKVTRIVREASPRRARGTMTAEQAAEVAQLAPVPAPRSHAILFAQKTAAKSAAVGRTLAAEAKRRGTSKRVGSRAALGAGARKR